MATIKGEVNIDYEQKIKKAAKTKYPDFGSKAVDSSDRWEQDKKREGYEEGLKDAFEELSLIKEWFDDIAELALQLSSGNVAHLRGTILGRARNCSEYVENYILKK